MHVKFSFLSVCSFVATYLPLVSRVSWSSASAVSPASFFGPPVPLQAAAGFYRDGHFDIPFRHGAGQVFFTEVHSVFKTKLCHNVVSPGHFPHEDFLAAGARTGDLLVPAEVFMQKSDNLSRLNFSGLFPEILVHYDYFAG
jgi:hypothetical protein